MNVHLLAHKPTIDDLEAKVAEAVFTEWDHFIVLEFSENKNSCDFAMYLHKCSARLRIFVMFCI